MVPHTITHCINDDASFLRDTAMRDIKYHILNILIEDYIFYASQSVRLAKLLSHLSKKTFNFIYTLHIQVPAKM